MKITIPKISFLLSVAAVCSWLHADDATPKEIDPVVTTSSAYQLLINLDANGTATIDGKALDEKALVEILGALIKKNPEASVYICASEKAKYEPISNIMDLCRRNGVKKFVISSKP